MKPILKYLWTTNDQCGVTSETKEEILARKGTDNVRAIRNATKEDIEMIRSMGGLVPDKDTYRIEPFGVEA